MATRWSREDDATLRRLYAAGWGLDDIATVLGRSADAVTYRRRELGVPARRPHRRVWTARHDALIRGAAAAGVSAAELARRIGLPVEAVRHRRGQLGLARPPARRYDAREDEVIEVGLGGGRTLEHVAELLGRPVEGVRHRAARLGLLSARQQPRWSGEDDDLLREGYASAIGCDAIARDLLPQRTPEAVATRARKLGLTSLGRRWTADDDERLRALADHRATLPQAAARLVRTPEAVRARARTLGVWLPAAHAVNAGTLWRPEEDEVLREWAALDDGRLGTMLGRSDRAVAMRRRALGLPRTRSPHHPLPATGRLTPGEQRLIAREARGASRQRLRALARRLGRRLEDIEALTGSAPAGEPAQSVERAV